MSNEQQPLESNKVDLDEWKERWAKGATGFHQDDVTPGLVKHWQRAVSRLPADKQTALTVLVPLCGASRDMVWLLDRPEVSSVVGIEICELALQRLLSENPQLGSNPSERRSVGAGVECWETSDGRLKFYLGDMFATCLLAELQSRCQVVWDRASLVAIDAPDRERYASRLREMCEPRHVRLMELAEYDRSKYAGPPHSISEDVVRSLFSQHYQVQLIDSTESPPHAEKFGLTVFNQPVYLLSSL